jgi:phospholipase/carboxylesterase
MLESVIINPKLQPSASVIWCHGLGADGHDFADAVKFLGLPETHGIRFIFPHAPVMPVTLNQGMKMRSWFDIYALEFGAKQDKAGIHLAQQQVEALVAREIDQYQIPAQKIVVAGFSQGGALALQAGLRLPVLAGILALSTYLPLADTVKDECAPAALSRPIFMCHGNEDFVVPIHFGEYSRDHLLQIGCENLIWREYPIGHTVNMNELRDIGAWLADLLC